MFDHNDEDRDLESQVRKGAPSDESARSVREGTPGPQPNRSAAVQAGNGVSVSLGSSESPRISASPSPTMNEHSSSADKPPPS